MSTQAHFQGDRSAVAQALTVRAYRAIFGVDAVLYAGETAIAWRIAGGDWHFRPREAANIVERFGHQPVPVPAWATAPDPAALAAEVSL